MMLAGAITGHIDVAQLVTAVFFLFFAGLIFYLRREDRREGYPLVDPADRGRPDRTTTGTKQFELMTGGQAFAPHHYPQPPLAALPPAYSTGNRLTPTGDPLLSAVGPGTWVMRSDQPFTNRHGETETQPLRLAKTWSVMPGDTDPRGMPVYDARRVAVGTVADIWVDQEVRILRYLEVALTQTPRTVLIPIYATRIDERRRQVRVTDLLAPQFAAVPALAHPDQISAREEDQVNAYCAGGAFFNRGVRTRA